jgi:hypothetical protein
LAETAAWALALLRLLPERLLALPRFSAALAAARQALERPAGQRLGQTLRKARLVASPAVLAIPALCQPQALLAARPTPFGAAQAAGLAVTAATQQLMAVLVALAV